MTRDERPIRAVPRAVLALLAFAGLLQLSISSFADRAQATAHDLPPPPDTRMIRLAGLGENAAVARVVMLYLQSLDLSGGVDNPYRHFDFGRLTGWLRSILDTDPRSGYPLFSAARLYAEVPDPRKARAMLEFLYATFQEDPNGRWQWLAHGALLAKHRLGDLTLARRYAAAIAARTTDPGIPLWARQMEVFILEDMNELQAAEIMLGGLIDSHKVTDPDELRFLKGRLDALRARLRGSKGPTKPSGA